MAWCCVPCRAPRPSKIASRPKPKGTRMVHLTVIGEGKHTVLPKSWTLNDTTSCCVRRIATIWTSRLYWTGFYVTIFRAMDVNICLEAISDLQSPVDKGIDENISKVIYSSGAPGLVIGSTIISTFVIPAKLFGIKTVLNPNILSRVSSKFERKDASISTDCSALWHRWCWWMAVALRDTKQGNEKKRRSQNHDSKVTDKTLL